jgi:SAM-dependent methyltransferase
MSESHFPERAVFELPAETVYGHVQRVHWMRAHLERSDRVLEVGCGTGHLIAFPLLGWGYNVVGVDIDEQSITYGKHMLEEAGLDPSALIAGDVRSVLGPFDAVIVSEVLEHLNDRDLDDMLAAIRERLAPGGRLIVTVPNGYGLFELENFLFYGTGLDRLYQRLSERSLVRRLKGVKRRVAKGWIVKDHPMTLAQTPHLQRFTWRSVHRLLARAGFDVVEARGTVQVCGPFSDMLFSGHPRAMELNARLGKRLSRFAAGFYLVAKRA